jgi:hypothetical protein
MVVDIEPAPHQLNDEGAKSGVTKQSGSRSMRGQEALDATFRYRPHTAMNVIHRVVISAFVLLLCALPASGEEKGASPIHVVPLDTQNIAWITLTDKLEVVIAFKEPIEDIHSAMWKRAGDIDAALKLVELLQTTLIRSLEINTKDALSIREHQRCKVRCEIVGVRFAPAK